MTQAEWDAEYLKLQMEFKKLSEYIITRRESLLRRFKQLREQAPENSTHLGPHGDIGHRKA